MAESYGVKWVYGMSLFLTAVFTLLSPVVAYWHWIAFMVLRALQVGVLGYLDGYMTQKLSYFITIKMWGFIFFNKENGQKSK